MQYHLEFLLRGFGWFPVDLLDRSSRGLPEDFLKVVRGFIRRLRGLFVIVFEDFGDMFLEGIVFGDPFRDREIISVFSASGGDD